MNRIATPALTRPRMAKAGNLGRKAGADMHRRPLAPDGSARADRDDSTERCHGAFLERDAPTMQNAGFHDIGDAVQARAILKIAHQ